VTVTTMSKIENGRRTEKQTTEVGFLTEQQQ